MKRLTKSEIRARSSAASLLGSIRTPKKARSSAINGCCGGRPSSGLASDREVRRRSRAFFASDEFNAYLRGHLDCVCAHLGVSQTCFTRSDWVRFCSVVRKYVLSSCPARTCISFVLSDADFSPLQSILLESPVLL